ncbi:hypothetical protein [Streptomyces sp. PSKA30]|uniref:hypothetical protein n=1 Tax=Streptomyces sp. PSKA30 TaxID=2874597 RepID=UPI001CD044A1|nr:hypothetical protein [Streptomyces sp. PSKA30]MBZ9645760.1 hypothetical protein [Streptomyces sp. PSKA30]
MTVARRSLGTGPQPFDTARRLRAAEADLSGLPDVRNVPPPQATVNDRNLWARSVAQDWAEQRHRSPDSAAATLDSGDDDNLPVGASELRQRLARLFFVVFWGTP